MTHDPLAIVLVDDEDLIRYAVSHMLRTVEDFDVVATAGAADEAVACAERHQPDVLLMDLWMHGEASLPAIPAIRQVAPETRIVMLTGDAALGPARQALREGAAGYVLKAAEPQELIRAIRAVAVGNTYVQPELGARLAVERTDEPTDRPTNRERQILALLAAGQTNAEAAAHLGLSVRTVETHRARLQQKLGVYGRSNLVRYARMHGIVED